MRLLPENYSQSTKVLILSNLATIALALIFNWSIMAVMVGFWVQSVIIGFFTILKILLYPGQETGNRVIAQKIFAGGFFTLHYGLFNLVHGIFLLSFINASFFGVWKESDFANVALIGAIFFVNHAYSFYTNYMRQPSDFKNYKSPFEMMFEPYARIVPMHVSIIAGGFFAIMFPFAEKFLLVFFLVVKGTVDIRAHISEHQKVG